MTGFTASRGDAGPKAPVAFSAREDLSFLWEDYKEGYIKAGRVGDKQNEDLTTSEGQSYAMLRAVWLDDRETFDAVWEFTRVNLKRPNDSLFAWRFGQRLDGTAGILTEQGGQNTASDADTDIALALVMAYGRWQAPDYLKQASPIISDIWTHEVAEVDGQPVLAASDFERNSSKILVNPSYLSPHAYRIFAAVDTGHDWNRLVASSYDLIDRVLDAPLDRGRSAGLPPNWVRIDRRTGAFLPLDAASLTSDYGYDALRLPWRIALDHSWSGDERAVKALNRMSFLKEEFQRTNRLAGNYTHDGTGAAGYEVPAMYGGSLGLFTVTSPETAKLMHDQKLASLIDPGTRSWRKPLSYYDDNWAWFGLALHQGVLTDLAEGVRT